MTGAVYDIGHGHGGSGFVPGARPRHLRTIVIAAVVLVLIWTVKKSPLFREHVSEPAALPTFQPSSSKPWKLDGSTG